MYIEISGIRYWVEQHGEGPPIVLFHGFTGSSRTWDRFIDNWKQSFRLITVDMPGHGKTETNIPMGMEVFCEHINLLLDKLSIKQAAFLGYSMGGRATLSFAMLYPEAVKALVLESASPGLLDESERMLRRDKDERLAEKIEEEGITSFVDYWENIPLFESQSVLSNEEKQKIRCERLSQDPKGLAASLRGMGTGKQPSWWGELSSLSFDVLLIAGELDEKFVSIAQKMKRELTQAQLEIIPNAGHAVHVEQPETFGTIVSDFLHKGLEAI
ncbi:2-succinyl-6-hydroxy-2,4-cyclohexadiene-1-carboxylate synthase [Aquibacillus albus]|uniref:Putative 2-succinyl-6-hydroxy-2,4-cyclohexadiene-1-carboxylate synthase n=1 Tax=Aquibacillus albus TaxID=1168171 RepID=A0ABS2MYN4_9BACI|nr:2-succinyl-6-hydroxy-2,4-cyclohexadiene-1-carboxylate synthase [Aquibacillus albus]